MSRSPPYLSALLLEFLLPFILSAFAPSLSLPNDERFGSNLVLIGDAKFAKNGSSIELTDPGVASPSAGFLFQKKPMKLLAEGSAKPTSFSTDFSFSISPHNGDGLAFLFVPTTFVSSFSPDGFGVFRESRFLGVEFDTSLDENLGDVNANHVGIDVGSLVSVTTSNLSSTDLVLRSGVKLHSWVDYDASSKSMEVRLVKFGNSRPHKPLLACHVDMVEIFGKQQVSVCLSSSSRSSMQISSVYSWNFRTRNVPQWLHSQPANVLQVSSHDELSSQPKKRICFLGVLSGLVFVTGCGALLALIVLFLWASFENSAEAVVLIPSKTGEFRYEKINVVVDADELKDVKK